MLAIEPNQRARDKQGYSSVVDIYHNAYPMKKGIKQQRLKFISSPR